MTPGYIGAYRNDFRVNYEFSSQNLDSLLESQWLCWFGPKMSENDRKIARNRQFVRNSCEKWHEKSKARKNHQKHLGIGRQFVDLIDTENRPKIVRKKTEPGPPDATKA